MVDEGSPCDATTDRLSRIDKIVILWLLDNDYDRSNVNVIVTKIQINEITS